MSKTLLASAAALLIAGAAAIPAASAAPLAPSRDATGAGPSGVESVRYYYDGRDYCWYYDGWKGPGWYWCGYSWRRGLGWGSPVWGWNNWVWSGPRYRVVGPRHHGGVHLRRMVPRHHGGGVHLRRHR